MPVTYRIDPEEQIVYLTTVGEASFEEFSRALLDAIADPAYRTGFDFLSDRRDGATPTSDFANRLAYFFRNQMGDAGKCRWAAVVSTPAAYGMTRMMATVTNSPTVSVAFFYDLDEARRWLRQGRDEEAGRA